MEERIPHLQDRQFAEHADFLGMDYPSFYMCKSKRGIKREDGGKDAYKLPHRLIEKKRRDRINECIGQLKDLLPEHLKLSTLGHLEKAVVLELTLKHLNALTAVTEQQHQKIIALQKGDRPMKPSIHADLDAFHSGFQACAKEVLQYLSRVENWTAREQRCAQLIGHLHKVLAQSQPPQPPQPPAAAAPTAPTAAAAAGGDAQDAQKAEGQANCVPVIQRTQGGELNENDTDTDSGYGGEADKGEGGSAEGRRAAKIKQEFGDEHAAKKAKLSWSGSGAGPGEPLRPDVALMNSLMGISGVGQQTPICMPFYFFNPSAAASYMPLFDKSGVEKYVYPAAAALASPFPWLYPAHAAAAAAAFPALSAHFGASPQPGDSRSPDSDESAEGEAASGSEAEASPDSQGGDSEALQEGQSRAPQHFSACQTS